MSGDAMSSMDGVRTVGAGSALTLLAGNRCSRVDAADAPY